MRTATPAVTQYVTCRRQPRSAAVVPPTPAPPRPARREPRRRKAGAMSRAQRQLHHQPAAGEQDAAVAHASSSSRWSALRLRACWSAARSTCRSSATTSSSSRARCASRARWSCRPAAAASSTATACCSPPACRRRQHLGDPGGLRAPTRRKLRAAGQAAGHDAGRARQAAGRRDQNFVWLQRQVDEPVAQADRRRSASRASTSARNTSASTPRAKRRRTWSASPTSRTSGQEGIELAFQQGPGGPRGSRRVIKDRLGRVVEDIGEQVPPVDGRDIAAVDRQQGAVLRLPELRDAVAEHKAKAGSVVVLDVQTGEVLALANYPSYDPAERQNLTGAQLRNRALTDTFEPGSTMKPFIAALALETGRVTPDTRDRDRAGPHHASAARTISDAHPHGVLTVARGDPEVEQRRHRQDGDADAAARDVGAVHRRSASARSRRSTFPGAVTGRLRPYKTWRPIEQATMSYGYGLSASLFQLARAYTVFARDGELIPVTHAQERRAGRRACACCRRETAQAVRKMLQLAAGPGGTAPQGADHRLLGRRQDRHRAQAGRQGLREQQVPRAGSSAWRRSTSRASSSR